MELNFKKLEEDLTKEIKDFKIEKEPILRDEFPSYMQSILTLANCKQKFYSERFSLVTKRFDLIERCSSISKHKKSVEEKYLFYVKTNNFQMLYSLANGTVNSAQLAPKNEFEREILLKSYFKDIDFCIGLFDNFIKYVDDLIKTVDFHLYGIPYVISLENYNSHLKID